MLERRNEIQGRTAGCSRAEKNVVFVNGSADPDQDRLMA
jgi:hypothetical protein